VRVAATTAAKLQHRHPAPWVGSSKSAAARRTRTTLRWGVGAKKAPGSFVYAETGFAGSLMHLAIRAFHAMVRSTHVWATRHFERERARIRMGQDGQTWGGGGSRPPCASRCLQKRILPQGHRLVASLRLMRSNSWHRRPHMRAGIESWKRWSRAPGPMTTQVPR
jgi:hypothetical protein